MPSIFETSIFGENSIFGGPCKKVDSIASGPAIRKMPLTWSQVDTVAM
eukprot:gene24465-10066_t